MIARAKYPKGSGRTGGRHSPFRKRTDVSKRLLACLLGIILFLGAGGAFADNDTLETAGDVGLVALPAAAAAMTVLNKDWEGTRQLGKVLLSTAAVTGGLKLAVNEKAPNGDDHAFPSGHTSIAFAGASFLQRRYGWGYGAPAYLAAAFVGYSRVETDHHRFHDVLAGAAIGIVSNVIFTTPYGDVSAAPILGHRSIGAVFRVSFP
jgi:membrane-associated phospholipid phosphatase